MRIETNPIYKVLFIFLLIIELRFLSIPGISSFFSPICTYHLKILSCVVVFLMGVFVLRFKRWRIYISMSPLVKVMIFWVFIILITFGISSIVYSNVSIMKLLKQYHFYFSFILFFILIHIQERYPDYAEFVIRWIIHIVTIYAIYAILTKYAYDHFHITLMDGTTQLFARRNDSLRLAQISDYVALAGLLSALNVIKAGMSRTKKMYYFICSIICTFAIFYVSQTRAYEILMCLVLMVILWFSENGFLKKLLLLLLALLSLFLLWKNIQEFIASFSELTYSTENRLGGMRYYLSESFRLKIIGIGFPTTDNLSIIRGGGESYALTDCGYIGVIGVFGVLGMLFLLMWLKVLIGFAIYAYKNVRDKYCKVSIIGIVIYLVESNLTLGSFDPQRCIQSQILLALLYYFVYLYPKKCGEINENFSCYSS